MQAGIYVRISQDPRRADPDTEGRGVARQQEDCEALAESLGWTVAEVYRDNDTSASTTAKPREHYQRMLDDIRSGRIDAIIAWHPDRLYRRLTDLEELCDVIDEHQIKLRTVQSGHVDLSTPSGQLVAGMLGVVAKHEVRHKTERWQRAIRQQRESGKMPKLGGAVHRMFGWTTDGEIVETEADWVRRTADAVIAGETLGSVCRRMRAAGVTTTEGNPWQPTKLRPYLSNPRLAGYATLRGEIVGQSEWPAILTVEKWQTMRALLSTRIRPAVPRVALLAGMIYCRICEEPLTTGSTTKGNRTYRCNARPWNNNCGRITASAAKTEAVIEGVAKLYLSRPAIREAIAAAQASGNDDILADLDAEERHLAALEDSLAERGQNVQRLLRAIDTVSDRIADLRRRLAVVATVPIPEDIDMGWPTELAGRRRLVELVIKRVWIDPQERRGPFDPSRVDFTPTDLVRG